MDLDRKLEIHSLVPGAVLVTVVPGSFEMDVT